MRILNVARLGEKSFLPVFGGELGIVTVTEVAYSEGESEILLRNANGDYIPYYTFYYEKDDDFSILTETKDITDIFGLTDSDADILSNHIKTLLLPQLTLAEVPYTLESGDPGILYCNALDIVIASGEVSEDKVPEDAKRMADNHTPVRTLLVKILEAMQTRFNDVNFYQKAENIAKIIKDIRYMNDDGSEKPLNLTAIDNLFSNVKDKLLVDTK